MSQPFPNIPPAPPQPIRLLDADPYQRDAVTGLTASIADRLRDMPGVTESHQTVDYIDVVVDRDVEVRVQVQALRRRR